jgi:hypothetical protein
VNRIIPKKLYSNLRQLGVINESNKVEVENDVERMNPFFVMRSFPQNELAFEIPVRLGDVTEFSFITVGSKDVFDAFMACKVGRASLSFVKMLLPVVLPVLMSSMSSLPDESALLCYHFREFLTLRVSLIFVRLVFFPVCPRLVRC